MAQRFCRLNSASPSLNDLIKKSIKLSPSPPERYLLQTTRSSLEMEGKIRRWTFGQKYANMENKTILMVGETGTGKTTLINTMVNYYLGVRFEDKVWFEITEEKKRDQSESQTSEITAYEIVSDEKPFFLTIIDTPGFGDTRGIDQDMKIAQNLHKLFLHDTGVKDLDAVCLVLKASQNRISDAQRYIFEGVLSLFGKDIEDIIVLFITHSDGETPTNVLEAVKKEKIPCSKDDENEPVHFLFNNRQSETTMKKYEHVLRASWEMGEKSLEEFFEFQKLRQRKSVGLTASVLKERIQLEACVQSLKERIKYREEKKGELRQIQALLKENKEKIAKDENFPFTVTTVYKEKMDITGASWWNRKVTSCVKCQENCHEFGCWWSSDAEWCEVMNGNHCTVCGCHYSKHIKEGMKYVTKKKEESVTFKALKNKYSNINQSDLTNKRKFKAVPKEHDKKLKQEEEMTALKSDLIKLLVENENEKKLSVNEAYKAIIKLSEIALKPDSAFTVEYLDFLIPRVEKVGEAEWAQRLKRIQADAAKESTKSLVGYLGWMRSKIRL